MIETITCTLCETTWERTRKGGYKPKFCTACKAKKKTQWSRNWHAANPNHGRDYYIANREVQIGKRIQRTYGISPEQYDAIVKAQGGHCGLCVAVRDPSGKALHVDHDHGCCPGTKSCGRCVRGVLCLNCNYTVGLYEKRPVDSRDWARLNDYLAHPPARLVLA